MLSGCDVTDDVMVNLLYSYKNKLYYLDLDHLLLC